ncbi:DUF445 family protein [Bacillus salacetis]|uniref:DUF445 family protein n=1 Tax=Bacillus salacetis TaxID=2315464 RepID=A0A3A1QTG0_9BACI|nr:DUF445 family protein [Bacillus salacetis]RIW30920.1 DUF445 family protein [Bacillus salacetis]
MEIIVTFIIMVLIGAAIGGFTNSLAIKMLFRPYNPVYIGKWRVPFTPGLIPKRRSEMAVQLGEMVVHHLITPESIQKKLSNGQFRTDAVSWIGESIEPVIESDENIEAWLKKLRIPLTTENIESGIENWIDQKYHGYKEEYRSRTIEATVPLKWQEKVEAGIPMAAEFIAEKGEAYFNSPEGRRKVKIMIDDFLEGRGMLGNMLGMFLGNSSLSEKIQPEIIKFIKHDGTKEILRNLLKKEWEKLKESKWEDVLKNVKNEEVLPALKSSVLDMVSVENLMSTDLKEVLSPFKQRITGIIVPHIFEMSVMAVSQKIEIIMEKLHLQEVVREQVETFSVQRLEELVLGITSKELKMITYLGALLGGIIGLVQGAIVLFIA